MVSIDAARAGRSGAESLSRTSRSGSTTTPELRRAGKLHALRTAGRSRRALRTVESRRPAAREADALRCGAGGALPIAGRYRHRHPESGPESLQRPNADSRAKTRDGRSRAKRVARREQRARLDAAAGPANAGGPSARITRPGSAGWKTWEQLQRSLQVCRRIFGGMLVVFSRRRATSAGRTRARGRR